MVAVVLTVVIAAVETAASCESAVAEIATPNAAGATVAAWLVSVVDSNPADIAQLSVVQKTQHQGVAVLGRKFIHRAFEFLSNQFWFGSGIGRLHGEGGLFALTASALGPAGVEGLISSGVIQPGRQRLIFLKLTGFAGEQHENSLGNLLSKLRITNDSPRRGEHQIKMTVHHLPEGSFRPIVHEDPQQFMITCFHTQPVVSATKGNRTRKVRSTP